MFVDYVYNESPAAYERLIWINDPDRLEQLTHYSSVFKEHSFEVVEYCDDLSFRIGYEEKVKGKNAKLVVLNFGNAYIPYDILKLFSTYTVSPKTLFPKLNADVLRGKSRIDLDLLVQVCETNFEDLSKPEATEKFFEKIVYGQDNLLHYFRVQCGHILEQAKNVSDYRDWYHIAEEKAMLDRYSVQYELNVDAGEVNRLFQNYFLVAFGTLSSKLAPDTPVLVSRAMEYMHEHSDKFVVIVMDGMSEFDWSIISQSFAGLQYKQSAMFAMIPSTTSISRQCLLSNKFPQQLDAPWIQSKEKTEFTECAKELGYADNQIGYARGYDAEFGNAVRCGAVIINDVDDMIHAQRQGRRGMYHAISMLAEEGKLRKLTESLLARGFDVYITADHGNTQCHGIGKLVRVGVDVETKSHRMVVMKDFADKSKMMEQYGLIEYPKYYLPKEYVYLICDTDKSLDDCGDQVMTHGGMTIDEVVVPFITIKAGQNNG